MALPLWYICTLGPKLRVKVVFLDRVNLSVSWTLFVLTSCIFHGTVSELQVIRSPNVTEWGTWGFTEKCSLGTYVKAFQLKTERYTGPLDDTGLNGIRFYCGFPCDENVSRLTSSEGPWGSWGDIYTCNMGHAIGFQLRIESPSSAKWDQTGANNLRIVCSNMGARGKIIEGDGSRDGEWTDAQLCEKDKAICSLRTQVQDEQGLWSDDTALNNVAMECCDLQIDNENEIVVIDYDTPTKDKDKAPSLPPPTLPSTPAPVELTQASSQQLIVKEPPPVEQKVQDYRYI